MKRLIEEDDRQAAYLVELGQAYQSLGNMTPWKPDARMIFHKAVEALDRAIEIDPSDANIYWQRGIVHHLLSDSERQFSDYKTALELAPTAHRHYKLAGILFADPENQDRELARYHLREALRLKPDNAEYLALLGKFYAVDPRDDEEPQKALELCNRAVELAPSNYKMYIERSAVLRNLGEYEKALEDAETAIRLKPNFWSYRRRAEALTGLGRLDTALADYTRALTESPHDVWAYKGRAQILLKLANYDAAIDDLNRSLELHPKSAGVYTTRGTVFAAMGDSEAALADFNTAIECDSQYFWPFRERARLRMTQKEYSKAIEDYSRVLQLKPSATRSTISARKRIRFSSDMKKHWPTTLNWSD